MLLNVKQLFENPNSEKTFEYQIIEQSSYETPKSVTIFPINATGVAKNRAGVVTLKAELVFDLVSHCDRCLSEVKLNQTVKVNHTLIKQLSNDDVSDEYIEADTDQFDLDEFFLGEVLLALPSKVLCDEDCKGLCTVCGKNLNDGDCGCERKSIDPRLEILKSLLD